MHVEITGRNIDITPAIRDFTRDKLAKLDRWIDDNTEVHVVLSVEKHRHHAEVVLRGRQHTFTGTDETGDMYASIGNAVDKIEKQARRLKDKWTARRKQAAGGRGGKEPPGVAAGPDGDGTATVRRIIRVPMDANKPMSVEDAALSLAESDFDFYVFREARTQRINVIYRRRDGHLGLIDPES